jgi:hypothetical protein
MWQRCISSRDSRLFSNHPKSTTRMKNGWEIMQKVLDELRDKYLYIQNKNKPEGLIHLDFRTTPKKARGNASSV